jgi:hypothetical protein
LISIKKVRAQIGYLKSQRITSAQQVEGGACTGIFLFRQMGQSWHRSR